MRDAARQAEEEDMAYQARRLGHMIYPSGSWVEVTRMDDASYWVNRGSCLEGRDEHGCWFFPAAGSGSARFTVRLAC